MYWDGHADRKERLGAVSDASVYPAAWTISIDGTSELGFVLGSNWGFGYTEAWTWSASQGLARIDLEFYTSDAHADVRPGFEAGEIWFFGGDELLRFEPGTTPTLAQSTPEILSGHWTIATGNFDGSGRMSAVMEGEEALRVHSDGSLETLPLHLPEFDYSSRAADINGDGLDDIVRIDGEDGVVWMENLSVP